MKLKAIAQTVSLSALGLAMAIPAQAAFIEDSKASLELRNFYMNRDFRNNTPGANHKAEEWAQGFLFNYESGYTEGTVGVGIDVMGFAGFKLDSGRGTSGTGLLLGKQRNHKGNDGGHVPDSYGEVGAAAKFKLSETVLRAGTLRPKLPTVSSGDGRLIPQTFTGVHINSKEINNLTLDAGRLGRVNTRASTNNEPIGVWVSQNTSIDKKKVAASKKKTNHRVSSKFDFAGANYKWGDTGLSTAYHYGQLQDVYKQHILNGVYTHQIADNQSITADLRYAKSNEDGNSGIDNKALSGLLSYKLGYNNFAVGYQKMSGNTGYVYLQETDPFLTNYVQVRDFASTDEKSWQVRYIHDFASVGIPGLSLMARYVKGSNIYREDVNGNQLSRGTAWERDTDIAYVFQDGALKGLGIKWRNATVRSNVSVSGGAKDIDENRLIVSYTIPLM